MLFPLLGFENQPRAHAEIAVADAGVARIAIGGLLRGFDVGLRLVDVAEHQVGVFEPAERVEVLAAFGELHARVELGRRLVGDDVRLADVFPHAALHEDVRRHMERVRRRRRDARVRARRGQRERRVIGIVERVNDEVRRARMLRVFREHLLGDRRGERLAAESLVGRPHGAEQRQRVPRRHFVIVRPLRIHRAPSHPSTPCRARACRPARNTGCRSPSGTLSPSAASLSPGAPRRSARSFRGSPSRPCRPAAPTADGCGSSPRPSTPSRTTDRPSARAGTRPRLHRTGSCADPSRPR